MDCEHTNLLLPWFLNGSLDADERRRVSEHLVSCERCRQERAATERAGEIFSQHLPAAVLVDHGFGRAAAGLNLATIEEHLAICPRCAAELELVREAAWRSRGEEATILPFVPRHAPPRPAPAWRWAALAAGLTLVVGAGTGWRAVEQMRTNWQNRETAIMVDLERARSENAQLAAEGERGRSEIAQLGERLVALEAPRPNVGVIDLHPRDSVQRAEREPELVEAPADAAELVFLLQPPGEIDFPSFELEIENPEGKRLFPIQKLVRQDEGDFTVGFPTAKLPLGKLTLRLFGRRDEERREIARYDVLLIRETVRE